MTVGAIALRLKGGSVMGGPGDKPLKVMTPFNEVDVGKAFGEEPLHVMTPFNEADVGKAPAPPVTQPLQDTASYTIRTKPPDGAVTSFSSHGPRTADDYDNAIFVMAPDGNGTFQFLGKQAFPIRGMGTVSAAEVRVSFEAPNRGMRGGFVVPRNGQTGEVKLSNQSDQLVARATVGVSIDVGSVGEASSD
ncbi:MAG TPA: hypothetical protein VNM34_02355 [Verrucomicrobiae bacterium]|nr:hypothetical protein [Verrucomicrobiae bacterium]